MSKTRIFVLACFTLIGLFDLGSGIIMAGSSNPWQLNGMGAVFEPLLQANPPGLAAALMGPYFRLAAFSFHVGALTLFLTWYFRRNTRALTALFLLYTVDGLGFAYYDNHFAFGTNYYYVKQVIGVFWSIALIAHLVEAYRTRKPNLS